MKSARMCVPVALLAALLAVCLSISFGRCSSELDKIEPKGKNVGAVRFDAVIELKRYSPDLLYQDSTMIFARYWVACDYYCIAVVWAEPQSTDMFFTVRPQNIMVSSNEDKYVINHESIKKENETHKKPLSERGVFRYKFGSYPIDNIRFAEHEALSTRICATYLKGLKKVGRADGKIQEIQILPAEDRNTRYVAQLKVNANDQRIVSMQLFDAEQKLLKSINYEYENNEGSRYLSKLTAVLSERLMTVGFNTGGMKVTLDGKEYHYRELEATHHQGERKCIVEYEPVIIDDKDVTLPVGVIVSNKKDDRILRSVRLMNFKRVNLDAIGAGKAAIEFGGSNTDEHKYWAFRSKYWDKKTRD